MDLSTVPSPYDGMRRVWWLGARPAAAFRSTWSELAPLTVELPAGVNANVITENRYGNPEVAYIARLKHCTHHQYSCCGGGSRKPRSKRCQWPVMRSVHTRVTLKLGLHDLPSLDFQVVLPSELLPVAQRAQLSLAGHSHPPEPLITHPPDPVQQGSL